MKKSTIRYKKIKRAITTSFKRLSVAVKKAAEGVKDLNISVSELVNAQKILSQATKSILNKREQIIVAKYVMRYPYSERTVREIYILCNKSAVLLRKVLQQSITTEYSPELCLLKMEIANVI